MARNQHVAEESEHYSSDAAEENRDVEENFQERDWFSGNIEDEQDLFDLFDETDLDDNFPEGLENNEKRLVNSRKYRGLFHICKKMKLLE